MYPYGGVGERCGPGVRIDGPLPRHCRTVPLEIAVEAVTDHLDTDSRLSPLSRETIAIALGLQPPRTTNVRRGTLCKYLGSQGTTVLWAHDRTPHEADVSLEDLLKIPFPYGLLTF